MIQEPVLASPPMLPEQTGLLIMSKLHKTLTDLIFVLPFLTDSGSSCSHRACHGALCSLLISWAP